MQTCTVGSAQLSGPHSVPSSAVSVAQPAVGSQVAAWQVVTLLGQTCGGCRHPTSGLQASSVQGSPSSHETAAP
jgi:hypothetical protein